VKTDERKVFFKLTYQFKEVVNQTWLCRIRRQGVKI